MNEILNTRTSSRVQDCQGAAPDLWAAARIDRSRMRREDPLGPAGPRNPGPEPELTGRADLHRVHPEPALSRPVSYGGLAEDPDDHRDEPDWHDGSRRLDRRLLDHFRGRAADAEGGQLDLQVLDQLISEGADPNSSDRYGQTVLHEISRAWTVDVMRFFLDRGSDLHRPDHFGVTALHVAAALDYQDMVHFLLERGGDVEARTLRDRQTPLHFAAKNDAVGAMVTLLRAGADVNCGDYKCRTPLQLAANLERGDAARLLLELGAEAGTKDRDGQLCITAMIDRMSTVAQLALRQLHVVDRATRQQFFYLNLLEPEPVSGGPGRPGNISPSDPEPGLSEPTSPLELVVQQNKLDLIMNPMFLQLIQIKWKLYGRVGAWLLLLLNFLFNVAWTTVAISVSISRDSPDRYVLPEDWWRVLLVVLALLLTLEEVLREVQDMWRSRRKLILRQRWAERRLLDDLGCSHPMWPQERVFLLDQKKKIQKLRGNYYHDLWNICDWLVYTLLALAFGVHLADVARPSPALHTFSLRLFAVTIVFLWLRLMKHVRAFRSMGPFIVMLGNIVGDVMRFLFLYAEIFVPYACAFWIIFGGSASVPSMQTVSGLLFSLYRITLVDEYEFAAMAAVDSVMAPLLCGTFLAASSILCVNLLIALLTDTFQRVHDNSQANAVMQQAAVILQVEESMPFLHRFYDNRYIVHHCAPLAVAYDDDVNANTGCHDEKEHLSKEVKETLDQFLQLQRDMGTARFQADRSPKKQTRGLQGQRLHNLGPKTQTTQGLSWLNQQGQELRLIRAELKELQTLVKRLVQNGSEADQPSKQT